MHNYGCYVVVNLEKEIYINKIYDIFVLKEKYEINIQQLNMRKMSLIFWQGYKLCKIHTVVVGQGIAAGKK